MRSCLLVPILLAVLAAPAFAQGAGGKPRVMPGFQPEEWQKYGQLQQEVGMAFNEDDYERALPLLKEQIALLEKVVPRVEKSAVDSEEKEKQKKALLKLYAQWISGNWYNQACCHSMTGKKDEAIAALKKSLELGYMDLDHMKMDSDLDPIRETPEYKALLGGLSYNEVYEVYKPESAGETPVAILVALHWVNGNEKDFLEKWKSVADQTKTLLVAPRGPVTTGKGTYAWRRKSEDEDAALKKIRFTIEDVRKKYALANAPVYLMGVGEGGSFATLGAFKMPELVKGAIQINTFWNKYYMEEFLPAAKKAGTKVCLIHGKEDAFYAKAETAMEQMKGEEVASKLIPFEGGRKLPDDIAAKVKAGVDWLMAK